MDVALSKNGARLLRVFFALVVVFLYAPIAILLIFSFNKSAVPTFPLSGFTLHWYREFLGNSEIKAALETSAIIAAVSLDEAAFDLGASRLRTFRSITLPLILPAVVSAFLIAFTTSFDEYAVASFVVGTRVTFPIYLYSALRFPSQLPQVIAVAVVVMVLSLLVVVSAELGRRVAERRLGALENSG